MIKSGNRQKVVTINSMEDPDNCETTMIIKIFENKTVSVSSFSEILD